MTTMGRHSPPIDGTVANGRALAPFTLDGPVSVLPQPPAPRRAVSARVIESCYVLMAAVTVIATGVGFWLSYAGLHSFAARAGLSGPVAWAWPASVDLFILAGELGITISTLRDGRPDWRAWGYFAAGCGPSVAFNVLHVTGQFPPWGKYAVAATPPIAAVLALAALMQQVISLPAALRHMHGSAVQPGMDKPADKALDKPADKRMDKALGKPASRRAIPGTSQRTTQLDKAAAAIARHPGWTDTALARSAGVSAKTVHRARNAKTGSTT